MIENGVGVFEKSTGDYRKRGVMIENGLLKQSRDAHIGNGLVARGIGMG